MTSGVNPAHRGHRRRNSLNFDTIVIPAPEPGDRAWQGVQALRKLLIALVTAALAVIMASPAKAITNGEPDRGRHPYVGLAVFDVIVNGTPQPSHRCSGSLLSPTVFLTAGHCTDGTVAARVWFAEDVQTNPEYPRSGATSYDGTPYTNPDFCIECGPGLPGFAFRDVGIIVLSEPVPTSVVSRYAQLPSAGLVDTLPKQAPVTVVGYGVQERLRGVGRVADPADGPGPAGLGLVRPQRGVHPGDREPRPGRRHLFRGFGWPGPARQRRHGVGSELLCHQSELCRGDLRVTRRHP